MISHWLSKDEEGPTIENTSTLKVSYEKVE